MPQNLLLLLSLSLTHAELPLDALLAAPMHDIPHLHVLLRHQLRHEDAANPHALWFLQHTSVSHSVHSYVAQQPPASLQRSTRESFVVVLSLEQLMAKSGVANTRQRAGVYFFIVDDELNTLQQLQLEQRCRELWLEHKVYNRYIISSNLIWIYDPFGSSRRDAEEYGRLIVYPGGEPLPWLLFHNLRGYPLRVQIFKSVYARPELDPETGLLRRITGVDWQVAEILRMHLNYTMLLQEPDKNYFGERSPDGSYNGAIGSVMNDGLDICLTGFFVKDYLVHDYMDFTVPVYDDQLCIYVPKARRIPQSILPIFAVGYDIWLGFIFSAFGCALVWLTLRLINLQLRIVRIVEPGRWQQALNIIVDTWVVWVRVNLSHLPQSYAERMFIGSLCLVSVIFGAVFESSLATVYIHPLHYKDILTMQDLDDSGLNVIYKYTSMADDLFFSDTSPLFASLNKKLKWNKDLDADVTNEVATIGGKAGISRYSSLMMESANYLLTRRIWVVPECPKYYTISYVLPRDAPWEEAVNAQLLLLLNAGLIPKWIADQNFKVNLRMRKILRQSPDQQSSMQRVLTINDLQLSFYVVIGGTLLAWLAFLAEHVWVKCCRRH
ncbi:Ir10a [Drosophila busckii]|uniref:Ir10a n=1 Tax=Drosophila busckii TaxID=30019 RepID=A0A0M4EUA2_DROBS|nr:uncharacterized protein LOC108605120 [Drosophila busckii]ALC49301.1 Ir10a [Drosophila busckii]